MASRGRAPKQSPLVTLYPGTQMWAYYGRTSYGTRDKLEARTEDEAQEEVLRKPHLIGLVKITMQEIPLWPKNSTSSRPKARRATSAKPSTAHSTPSEH